MPIFLPRTVGNGLDRSADRLQSHTFRNGQDRSLPWMVVISERSRPFPTVDGAYFGTVKTVPYRYEIFGFYNRLTFLIVICYIITITKPAADYAVQPHTVLYHKHRQLLIAFSSFTFASCLCIHPGTGKEAYYSTNPTADVGRRGDQSRSRR